MQSIITFLLLLATLYACNPVQTENTTTTTDSTQTEPTTITTAPESFKTSSSYTAEIKRIDEEVAKINAQLASYKKDLKENNGCKIEKFLNKNDLNFKIISTCQDGAIWNFYFFALADKTNRIMYVQYEKAGVRRESYGIGLVIAGAETFGLVLDEKGNKMEGGDYSEYSQLEEAAYVGTM